MMRLLRRCAPRNDRRGFTQPFRPVKMLLGRAGFTLMEMVIMIAIGAVLFISVGRAAATVMEMAVENRNYLIALNIAKRQMSIMQIAAYPTTTAETAQSADAAFPSFIPTHQVSDVDTDGTDSIRLITVRVRLNSVTGPVLIRLDTYRSNVITFGTGS